MPLWTMPDGSSVLTKCIRHFTMRSPVFAKAGSPPSSIDELVGNIYLDAEGKDVPQPYIRMPDYEKSIRA